MAVAGDLRRYPARVNAMPVQLTAPEPVEQVRGYIVTGTDMRAAIAAERHDLAAVLRHRVRLCAHRRLIRSSDGWERAVAPEPESVAQFYAEVMAARRELDRYQRGTIGSRHRPAAQGLVRAPGGVDGGQRCRADPSSACLFIVPGASITEATSGFEWGAIRLTMLGCDFEVRPSPALVE